ncbi:Flavin reductase like domain protein [Synechococcus sp. PCC 7335]|uniref:diflavin flavoprotein n=1 Tax=Synechococcus sp. (strain ATCC 29403 / PCC 7335) TaxID=91464 RepID=UPI00017EBC61|nr:diflavin flavoprotein [Synechococcus sp. PCC 7335]EDX87145.1 Flavin reductase like domain protein [Synechococcus sp. PCC 7335]
MVALVDTSRLDTSDSLTLHPVPSCPRLTLQTAEIAADTTALRCLDWDRNRFDIEFELKNGTTYNSFLIRGEKTALVDTSHSKFRQQYVEYILRNVDPQALTYLIVNHTEPDHSGLIEDILAWAPHIVVVGSKVAIQFLTNMIHQPFNTLVVKSGHTLDLGKGHELSFVSAPNLHWPDTIFTYDSLTRVLYTCDVFGMHYCDDMLLDESPHLLQEDFQYYYDCLMGPNARSVLMALKRIAKFPVDLIATGHGPLLKHHREAWVEQYRSWSENQAKAETFVALFYMEDYGHSDRIVKVIAEGITKAGVDVELVEMSVADAHEVRALANSANGIVIGMPPQQEQGVAMHPALSTLLTSVSQNQSVGLFETGGGRDEPIYPLRNQLQAIGLKEAFTPIVIKQIPNEVTDQICSEAGVDLAHQLTRDKTIRRSKQIDSNLNRALGRLSGGLYIVTAQKGDVSGALLASWVMQASFEPLGIAISVAKDRAIESILQSGDHFVLNILEEGHYQPLMKHFLKRFAPGADRFEGIETYPATNGAPILAKALAYIECDITCRYECSDHMIVYATVQAGRVAKREGLTAVHHRKAGNHY